MAKVLIVDDSVDAVRLLTCVLKAQGYDVSIAYSGGEALGIARAERPDAVILDIMMPDVSGIEVCRRLKADADLHMIPVLLVTARDRDEDVIAGLDAGAEDYITKPFNGQVLAARLRAAIRVKESSDALARVNRRLRMEIDERERAEEALKKKDAELRQSQKLEAVGQLAGGIAHEFNNLLQVITGYAAYAVEDLHPEEQRCQDIQQVLRAARRAATLTRELLGFGRRHVTERKNIDPNEVVADLIRMVRPLIGEHIQLQSLPGKAIGIVCADPRELQQLMLNICLNARDAMPNGGTLTIKTENVVVSESLVERHSGIHPGRYVLIDITDTGVGMPPEVKQRIFEPFYTTKPVGKGTGLGLATVWGIVQQHEGAIYVYSEPGRGTTFKVYLPTVGAGPDTGSDEQTVPVARGTETILVAEDDPMVREFAARVLSEAGYAVLAAADGREALCIYEERCWKISLVLLDSIMPKLSGHEVYSRIRAINPDAKFIFCSGYDRETAQSDFIQAENLRLVGKPFDADTLLRTVREVLDEEGHCQLVAQAGATS